MPLIEASGRKVYYELHGPEEAPPLVLVMGLAGSCQGWHPLQVPEFATQHRLVLFDNRGIGQSEDPGGPFTTADLAHDLDGLLEALGIARAHVLGAFLGGMAAQELALLHPERIDRLVLVGTYARPDAKRRLLLEKWKKMARAGTSAEIFTLERLLWTLQDETLEQSDLVEAMSRSFPEQEPLLHPDLMARQCEACLAHDTYDRLREIEHPTLVLCGRQDQLTPPKFSRELADELPNGHLVTLPWGAHLVMAECAQEFNRTVLHFLEASERD